MNSNWRDQNVLMNNDKYYYTKYVGGNENWRDTYKYAQFLKNVPQFDNVDNEWAMKAKMFDQSRLDSDGYRYKHDWDYMQSRFQDVPERKLPDNQPFMHQPMPVAGPFPHSLPSVNMRSNMPTSDYDSNVVQAELLRGTEPFYEAVEDAEMHYRDDGNMPGVNLDLVLEAINKARQHYPIARKHLMDIHEGCDSGTKPVVQKLIKEMDESEQKVEDIANDAQMKGGVSPKSQNSFTLSKKARSDNNKKMFCCFVVFLILLAAVIAGAMWCRASKCHRMKW